MYYIYFVVWPVLVKGLSTNCIQPIKSGMRKWTTVWLMASVITEEDHRLMANAAAAKQTVGPVGDNKDFEGILLWHNGSPLD